MIRYLLGSTALLSAVIFNAYAYAAETSPTPMLATPQFKISGGTSFNSFFFRNKRIFQESEEAQDIISSADCGRNKFGRGQLFTVDNARLQFNVDGKTDPGMEYGLVFVLDGNVNETKNFRETYLYFGGTWGKVYAGDTKGVESTMTFGGWDQWGGTGGFDGGVFDRVVNYTTGTLHDVDLVGDTSRDTKLSYLTPRWNGIQVGVTYTPRTEHRGQMAIEARRSVKSPKEPFDTDNVASAINFIHKFKNGFEMALSAVSIFGKTHSEYSARVRDRTGARARNSTAAFEVGGTFSYCGVGFSLDYGNSGRSRTYKFGGNKSNAGQFLDFGLSYKWGATKFSTGYYYAWRKALGGDFDTNLVTKKAVTQGVLAAIDRKLAPGLGIYFEYANIQMKNPAAVAEAARRNVILAPCKQFVGPVKNSRANVFIIGSRLVF